LLIDRSKFIVLMRETHARVKPGSQEPGMRFTNQGQPMKWVTDYGVDDSRRYLG